MSLIDFKVSGYRSIRDLWLKLRPVNVIVGPNGCGKSNLYRSMYLLHCAARGELAQALAEEGGMSSVVWAGKKGKHDINALSLSMRSDKYEYTMVCGPAGEVGKPEIFKLDPEIKKEDIFLLKDGHKHSLIKRRKSFIEARDAAGNKLEYTMKVLDNESVLSALRDPVKFPELFALREEMLNWRFYHHFRTDAESPLRKSQIGVMTPVLGHDGKDIAAAFETIRECGDVESLTEALEGAFPGSKVFVTANGARRVLSMMSKEFGRPFDAQEFSDGTLQYICLVTALLSLRAPTLLALNEPEASLHPQLFQPLAQLIVRASADTQIWLTTHSTELADAILELAGYDALELQNVQGETRLKGAGLGGYRENDDVETS
ncbi:MAG: AAA family ATPase [Cyanobacteria bacterium SZAS LIN-5]|nr:AAA family ATPase [Cyanobacteria bacterium SZAS LIN-5]